MSFITEKNVLLDRHARTREEVLRELSDVAVELGCATSSDEVFAGFLAREQVDKTGMTDGFAIPHCKSGAIERATAVIYRNDKPLDWPSLDDRPVDVCVALYVPEAEAGTTHLKLLAGTARLLMDEAFQKLLRESDDAAQIADAVNEALGV